MVKGKAGRQLPGEARAGVGIGISIGIGYLGLTRPSAGARPWGGGSPPARSQPWGGGAVEVLENGPR